VERAQYLVLTPDAAATARIVMPTDRSAPVEHGARELSHYIAAILSVPALDIVEDAGMPAMTIALRLGDNVRDLSEASATAARSLAEDGYAHVVAADGISIGGMNARGALYGVYGLLHELGCRWLTPDDDGEHIPGRSEIRLPVGTHTSAPVFRRRGFGEDTRAVSPGDSTWFLDLVADSRRFADWMAKNRLNHFTTRADALADEGSVQDDLDRRGIMSLHGGGHNIPRLLPRELFAEHPEYFRMDDTGQRQPDGNLCVSNVEAVQILVDNALAEVRQNLPMEQYGIQGEDTWSGGWCECPQCRNLTGIQQNMLLCRAVAAGLQAAGLSETRVSFAAYRDTLQPRIGQDELPDRLFVRFAPRERSFGKALNDPTSDRNRWYAANLEGWAQLLGPDSLAITEYYTDSVLYSSFPVPLMRVIAADMRYFRDVRATAWIRVLFMSRYCWWAYPLNFYAVSRLAWDVDEPIDEIVAEFCQHRYGAAASTMVAFFNRFESAMARIATYGDIYGPPETFDPLVEQLMADIDVARGFLAETVRLGERALDEVDDERLQGRIRRELLAARFAANEVEALSHQVRGQYWYARASGNEPRFVFESEFKRGFVRAANELEQAIVLYRRGTDLLVNDPDAPRSAWLDSGLGLHRRKGFFLDNLERKVADCRAMVAGGTELVGE